MQKSRGSRKQINQDANNQLAIRLKNRVTAARLRWHQNWPSNAQTNDLTGWYQTALNMKQTFRRILNNRWARSNVTSSRFWKFCQLMVLYGFVKRICKVLGWRRVLNHSATKRSFLCFDWWNPLSWHNIRTIPNRKWCSNWRKKVSTNFHFLVNFLSIFYPPTSLNLPATALSAVTYGCPPRHQWWFNFATL